MLAEMHTVCKSTFISCLSAVCDRTCLMTAAENGHVAVCDYLIRQGARLDSLDVEGSYYRL